MPDRAASTRRSPRDAAGGEPCPGHAQPRARPGEVGAGHGRSRHSTQLRPGEAVARGAWCVYETHVSWLTQGPQSTTAKPNGTHQLRNSVGTELPLELHVPDIDPSVMRSNWIVN